ncbi:hypothetical protein J1D01_03230 [Seonamhaeicola sp. NFXS20]|uniref:hypothetical protein n=1 Tax=Seonamhaeicola sp. NFXS20 TaxID=2816959 RepID=UPI003B8B7EDB
MGNIPEIWFTISSTIITCVLGMFSSLKLFDLRSKKLNRMIKKYGKRYLLLIPILILIQILQFCNSNERAKLNKNALEAEQTLRDSLITEGIKKGVDDSREKLFKDVSKAFAKQGLRIDTLNNSIEKLKNIKTITNILPNEKDPILRVQMAGKGIRLEGDPPTHFRLDFRSDDAGSTNFKIKTYILIILNNGKYILEEPKLFDKDTNFSNTSLASIPLTNTIKDVRWLYFYITGTYSNLSKTKDYYINEVYRYDSETKKTGGLVREDKEKVINFIEKGIPKKKK